MKDDELFEYYKYLRKDKYWGDYPFWMYGILDIDVSEEKDDDGLWYEYNEFVFSLSNRNYQDFAHDAGIWAERNLP